MNMWVERYHVRGRALRPEYWHAGIRKALSFLNVTTPAAPHPHQQRSEWQRNAAWLTAGQADADRRSMPSTRLLSRSGLVVVHALDRVEALSAMQASGFAAALAEEGVQIEVFGAENSTVMGMLQELIFCCGALVLGVSALSSVAALGTTAAKTYAPHAVDMHLAFRNTRVKLPRGSSSPWVASWPKGQRPWYQAGLDLRITREAQVPPTHLPLP